MKLTHGQKKHIKRHYKSTSLEVMSGRLGIPQEKIKDYLRKLGKEVGSGASSTAQSEVSHSEFLSPSFSLFAWIKKQWVYFAALFLLIFLVFANSLFNGFVSDDVYLYVRGEEIKHLSSVLAEPHLVLRPLLNIVLYGIFGAQPAIFRLMNLTFHIGSVFLVFILIGILIDTTVGFLTASLLAIHPLIDEPVVWISGGSYPQYTFFLLLALLFYLLAKRKKRYLYLSLGAFVLALTSSEKAVAFPLLLLLVEFIFFSIKKNWKSTIAFFSINIIWVLIYISKAGTRITSLGTLNYTAVETTYNPFFQLPYAISSYLGLIVWPDKLTLYHSELAIGNLEYTLRVIALFLFIAALIFSYKKSKLVFFGLSFFVLSLSPVLLPFRLAWVVAERYAYLGSIGIFLAIAVIFAKFAKIKKYESYAYTIFFILLTAFSIRTIMRNVDWKNEDNLWVATAKTSPSSPNTHNNLGDVYARAGNIKGALHEFTLATQINPRYAEAYHNLANTYQQAGDTKRALENYQKAIQYNPNIWQSYQNIAAIYYVEKKYKVAETYEKKAMSINPRDVSLYFNLGLIYLAEGKKDKAREAFQLVLRADPTNERAKQAYEEASK